MEQSYSSCVVDDAEDVLESNLTTGDCFQLHEIYRQVNGQIKWQYVLDNIFPELLSMVEDLIAEDREDLTKGGSVWKDVSERDRELFEDGSPKAMARRHTLLLALVKKLLGGLKTRVNQNRGDIRVLSEEEEDALQEVINRQEDALRKATDNQELEDALDEIEIPASVEIAPSGECRLGGKHRRTTIRWRRKNTEMSRDTFCLDCGKYIEQESTPRGRSNEVCLHSEALWVEGKEGQEAICSGCGEPIKDPSTFKWIKAGLEPYGDDPSQDEAVVLCSEY